MNIYEDKVGNSGGANINNKKNNSSPQSTHKWKTKTQL